MGSWDIMAPEVAELLKDYYEAYSGSWAEMARAVQDAGYYGDLTIRQLSEKIRKKCSYDNAKEERHKTMGQNINERDASNTVSINPDGSRTISKLARIKDAQNLTTTEILELAGFKPSEWNLKSSKFKAWNAYSKNEEKGGNDVCELYSIMVTATPKACSIDVDYINEVAKLWRSNERFSDDIRKQAAKASLNGNILEINIADLHLGKLCWQGDTENNYDTKIARKIFFNILDDCIATVKEPVEKVVFVWANDFFNSDTIDKTTSSGTQQDTDIRWQKLFNIGCEILCESIIKLVSHFKCPIKTFYTESNHDTMASYYAIKVLEARFFNEPLVEVDINATPRKFICYGNTLIMYTHGHNETNTALASCMVVEGRQYWSGIKYAEVHAAHLHSEKSIEEINGILIRRLSSPTATDSWHKRKGYVGSVRKAQAFLINKDMGIRTIYNFPVDAYQIDDK